LRAVFGLGNPGERYEGTRHNVGFAVLDKVAADGGVRIARRRFRARVAETGAGADRVLLVKPQTFMNDSGHAVRLAVAWNKLGPEQILVVCDDLDLPVGKIRVRRKGSSGGHKGLRSIADALGTPEFPRLRIGIGRPAGRDAVEYVLDRFAAAERDEIDAAVDRAVDAVRCWMQDGIEACMNRFN
jgi:PTH1 family peptidyl-tRNA hydrolase